MPITLDRLPFDILFSVASNLVSDDIVSLAHTCKPLFTLLQENGICKKAVETQFQFTKEARLPQHHNTSFSYSDAFNCIQDRRNALANAHPFSARIVGQADDFCYRQGILCILEGRTIRVSDLHSKSESVAIDLLPMLNGCADTPMTSSGSRLSLLYYNDEILTVLTEKKGRPSSGHILAISTRSGEVDKNRLIIKPVFVEDTHKIFARHTSKYLYYGVCNSLVSRRHHEWEIQGIALTKSHRLPCKNTLQLRGFYGTDIGSTVAFEIHDDHFYAVSNQTSFEVEEIDWTSFYHCIKFPVNSPIPDSLQSNRKVWRRQHEEGVMHDSWTDLSLQVDEATNGVMIIEARREYQKVCSRQIRTFYISKFVSDPLSISSIDGSPVIEASTGPILPWGDAYIPVLDASNDPNYAPAEPRYNWNFHREVSLLSSCNNSSMRSFILARTKYRGYSYSAGAFLDLVEDDSCCKSPSTPPCLRLRIGSRRVAPDDWKPLQQSTPQLLSTPAQVDDVAYRHSEVRMWPPSASRCRCSQRLHRIMNPHGPAGSFTSARCVTGVMDERSLVYMVRAARSYESSNGHAAGVVVAISFNRGALPSKTQGSPQVERSNLNTSSEDVFKESEWHWQPGACQRGTCH